MFDNFNVSVRFFVALLGLVLCPLCFCQEPKPLETMRADQLIKEADFLLNKGEIDAAIPYLDAYLEKMKDVDDLRVRTTKQDIRFKLSKIFIKDQDHGRAIEYLRAYLDNRPASQWHEATKLLVVSLQEKGDFEACVTAATNALVGPPADVREALEKAALAAAAENDPDAYKFDEFGEIIVKDGAEVEQAEAHPSGYELDDLVLLNMTLGQAYVELGRVQESMEPFSFVVKYIKDPVRKGYAIMQVVNGLVEKKDFDALTAWVPELYQTDARYDIRVNMAFMNAASALFDAREYDNALPLFRMILPRTELLAYQLARLRELKIKAGLIVPKVEQKVNFRQSAKDTLFGKAYGVEEETFVERGAEQEIEKPQEIVELEQLIETIKTMPPYEEETRYRNAYLYDEVDRPWEGARFFDRVYKHDPESDLGKRSFYELIRMLLDPLDEVVEAETRGGEYLEAEKEGLVPRQIAYLLSGYYQQHQQPKKVKSLRPFLDEFVPDSNGIIRKYECELYYMQAVADLLLMNYELAAAGFQKILVDFPGSHQQENATYWYAATLVYMQEFEKALPEFEAYLDAYPNGTWAASAIFQCGTCQFGMENYPEAKALFAKVIREYPDAAVCPDALNLHGDILGSEGGDQLDAAILDYTTAFNKPQVLETQAKYATFQMARIYEADNNQYDKVLEVVSRYLDKYGEDADVAEGIFWIGKTKLNQGKTDEAVRSYFDAIIEYGTDLESTGVDSMIDGLVHISRTKLKEDQRRALTGTLAEALLNVDSQVLALRLRAMIAQIEQKEVELGRDLIQELPDLEAAAPPVLSAICKASFELDDYSRSEEILDVFQKRFEDSEFMRPAYKLRGYDLYQKGEFEAALVLIADAQARYGTDHDVAWAQILKGQSLAGLKRYDEALDELMKVMNVSGWRGATFAEAVYRLGEVEEDAGNYLKAHGWYQRTYFQFKGYADGYWAALGYIGSARCLKQMGYESEALNTYRAMLFNKYVNDRPECQVARDALGEEQARGIYEMIASGVVTNFTVTLEVEEGE